MNQGDFISFFNLVEILMISENYLIRKRRSILSIESMNRFDELFVDIIRSDPTL